MLNKSLKSQQGDFLMESLVGVVLMAIIATGMAHVSSRVSESQKESREVANAKTQMLKMVVEGNLCTGSPVVKLPVGDLTVTKESGCNPQTINVYEYSSGNIVAGSEVPVVVMPPKSATVELGGSVVQLGSELAVVEETPEPTPPY